VAQLALFADNRVSGRTDDDRLWELILKAGLPLGSLLTPFDAAGQPAYSLEEGRVVLCVAAPLTREALRALLAPPTGTPQLVICLDAAFQSTDADALKTNAVLEAKAMNIRFKTT
jgi:adenine-specific DNA-methyltransferase